MKTQKEVVKIACDLFFCPDNQLGRHHVSATSLTLLNETTDQIFRFGAYGTRKLSDINQMHIDNNFTS